MKKYIAMAAAVIMTISSVTTVNAANFYDINNVPWEGAKEYIKSVSDLGLMVGDTDSSGNKAFRANDRITYCEAMQLAYSILKNTDSFETASDNANIVKWQSKMEAANIPEWAYTCVAYGLEAGVLSENDIKIFMKSSGVNRDATRENVAVIFGKAIDHLSEINKSAVLTFNDKNNIASTSIPYVDLLARLEIIVGDDAGNFNPKNYINRAEMAVITSKTYYKIKELKEQQTKAEPTIKVVSGTVILTDDGSTSKTIAVSSSETGEAATFILDNSIPVIFKDGSERSYSDISIGDEITVSSLNGSIVSIIINNDSSTSKTEEPKESEAEGYLNNLTDTAVTFDTKNGEQIRYLLASNIKYYLDGGQVSKDSMYDLTLGRNIIYVTVKLNSSNEVYEIDAEMKNVEGEVTGITSSAVYIDFEYGGRVRNIKCVPSSSCEYYLEDSQVSETKLYDIIKENKLYGEATVNNFGKITRFDFYYDINTSGKLRSISATEISFRTAYGRTVTYSLDDAELTLDGNASTYRRISNKLDDFDILVEVEFDDNEENIISIAAKSLGVEGMLNTVDTKRVIVVDGDTRYVLPLPSSTSKIYCEYDGDEVTYSKLQTIFSEKENDMKAEFEMNDDYTLKSLVVTIGKKNEGTVSSISGTSITFTNVVGIEYTYKVEPAVRGYIDDEEVSLLTKVRDAALEDGATVRVTFSSRDYVNRIYVTTA